MVVLSTLRSQLKPVDRALLSWLDTARTVMVDSSHGLSRSLAKSMAWTIVVGAEALTEEEEA